MLKKFSKILILNFLLVIFLLAGIEVFFRLNSHYHFLKHHSQKSTQPPATKLFQLKNAHVDYDSYDMQMRAIDLQQNSNINTTVVKKLLPPYEDTVLYTAKYIYNQFGQRQVENQVKKIKATKFILSLGDSFTFGEGVSQGEDYPSQLAQKIDSSWKIYNLGRPGASTNNFIFSLKANPNLIESVREKSGIAIWLYHPDHLNRFFCPLSCHQLEDSYMRKKPAYEYDANDPQRPFKYLGRFDELETPYRYFLKILALSKAIEYSGFDIPYKYSDEHFKIFAKSLLAIKSEVQKKQTLKKIYVIFPNQVSEQKGLTTAFAHEGIEVLNLDLPMDNDMRIAPPFENHPKAEYYEKLSEMLKAKIYSGEINAD